MILDGSGRDRRNLWLLLLALVLSGCGLFGDNDDDARPVDEEVVVEPVSVRIESGDRWFDIDQDKIRLLDSGEPSAAAQSLLRDTVENLGTQPIEAVDAGVEHDGTQFVVVPSVPGGEPDIARLAALVSNADNDSAVAVPMAPVPSDISDADAQRYADTLNARLADGFDVAIGNNREILGADVIGPATAVSRGPDDWEVSIDYEQIRAPLQLLFPSVRTEGGDATFTIEPGETEEDPTTVVIVPGAPAVICCDEAVAEQIADVLSEGRRPINLLLDTEEGDRGTAWAESLGVTELVGSFSTRYTPGQTRNINIQRIAELTQGVLIEPGETFSLNEFVGRRTVEKGFVPAGTIVNGHLVDSVGGGISQYATTLFNASFFAGLEFEAYQSHSIYFSRYPYGREATISWPAPALKITNPTPHAILIWPTATDRSVTVDLYSTKWVDAEQTGQVERTIGVACTRVTTERTRTFLDGTVDVDSVIATYRKEGIACDGTETENPNDTTTTSTTIDPNAPTTTVDPNAPTTTVDPNAPTTTTTTTSIDPQATTTTTAPPETTTTTSTTSTTTTTTTTPPTTDP